MLGSPYLRWDPRFLNLYKDVLRAYRCTFAIVPLLYMPTLASMVLVLTNFMLPQSSDPCACCLNRVIRVDQDNP